MQCVDIMCKSFVCFYCCGQERKANDEMLVTYVIETRVHHPLGKQWIHTSCLEKFRKMREFRYKQLLLYGRDDDCSFLVVNVRSV